MKAPRTAAVPAVRRRVTGVDYAAIDALDIRRLETDSRRMRRGDTFLACPGYAQDGRSYIPDAIASGARSVLWEKRGFRWQPEWRVPNLGVARLHALSGLVASHVYHEPSRHLWMVGVTGTNGKTTCSRWIARGLDESGMRSGLIGTLGYGMRSALKPLINTTPDAVWLQAQLAAFLRRGARAVSMEVSSIGLDQDRVAGVQFDVALFTNLTRDHLDYHRTMRRYRRAKARLFECASLKYAILNVDDTFGMELAAGVRRRGLRVIGYGFSPGMPRRAMQVCGSSLITSAQGLRFEVSTPWGRAWLESPLLGRFNASNLLGTLAALLASGVRLADAVALLRKMTPAPGRMQTVGGGRRPLVVIDYAHSPDALEKVLSTLRELSAHTGRLTCVFGCGGDRDRGKRPLMGAIASAFADRVIITNDNPRTESPLGIVDDIVAGMSGDGRVELDRARAIADAVGNAGLGDIVLIAGKGHETYQEVKGVRRPFSDIGVARQSLATWSRAGAAA